MRPFQILSNLKKLSLPLAVALSSFSTQAHAQTVSPEGHYKTETGQIVINLNACKNIPCELQYDYIKIRVVDGKLTTTGNDFKIFAYAGSSSSSGSIRILSNVPIQSLSVTGNPTETVFNAEARRLESQFIARSDTRYIKKWMNISTPERPVLDVRINAKYDDYASELYVTALTVKSGYAVSIAEDMKIATPSLIAAYKGILEHLNEFRQIVARDSSDARHLSRLESQLKSALKIMIDEKGNPIIPVTHRKVTEASRMIMVLSTVLEDILSKYDFDMPILQQLKPAQQALAKLSRDIRAAYGWEEGLAGSGSKALAALSSILDTELRNMYSLMSAFNSDPQVAQTFNTIFRANSALYSKVNASNAGDVAGAAAARELLQQWNSQGFQSILSTMMSAPKEAQASLQNRILMALTAVESIKDYVDPKGESRINVDVPPNVRSKLN